MAELRPKNPARLASETENFQADRNSQAESLGWPFPMLKYKYIFQIKYTEAILSNNTRKLSWFEITKMSTAVLRNEFIVLFIIIFCTRSFPGLTGHDESLTNDI